MVVGNTTNVSSYFKNNNATLLAQPTATDTEVKYQDVSSVKERGSVFNIEKVLEAEILWSLHTVETHSSNNSVNETLPILKKMFNDSQLAQKMKLSSSKLGYYITFGLGPYFNEKLENSIIRCNFFVACFDEALNKISQKGQMDIVIRYWDEDKNVVQTR